MLRITIASLEITVDGPSSANLLRSLLPPALMPSLPLPADLPLEPARLEQVIAEAPAAVLGAEPAPRRRPQKRAAKRVATKSTKNAKSTRSTKKKRGASHGTGPRPLSGLALQVVAYLRQHGPTKAAEVGRACGVKTGSQTALFRKPFFVKLPGRLLWLAGEPIPAAEAAEVEFEYVYEEVEEEVDEEIEVEVEEDETEEEIEEATAVVDESEARPETTNAPRRCPRPDDEPPRQHIPIEERVAACLKLIAEDPPFSLPQLAKMTGIPQKELFEVLKAPCFERADNGFYWPA